MSFPRLKVDMKKLTTNVEVLVGKAKEKNISVMGVTKVFCAIPEITRAYVDGGVDFLADSRVENLAKLQDFAPEKVLLRLPMKSQANEVVKYVDISLNSEVETIKALDDAAKAANKIHKIILMIDLGDLREGIWPVDFDATIKSIKDLKNIKLEGIGVNLTCYGGVVPKKENLGQLIDFRDRLRNDYNIELAIVSGGNSSSLYLIDKDELPEGINNLRLGEALVLGRETAYGNDIKGTYQDAFILEAEIIELKEKPSLPIGEIGMDAFGNKPSFEDKGIRKRAILAVGRQDVNQDNLIPVDEKISIFGASSDHLIIDLTDCDTEYKVGDIVSFKLEYGALLSLCTSEYISKVIV